MAGTRFAVVTSLAFWLCSIAASLEDGATAASSSAAGGTSGNLGGAARKLVRAVQRSHAGGVQASDSNVLLGEGQASRAWAAEAHSGSTQSEHVARLNGRIRMLEAKLEAAQAEIRELLLRAAADSRRQGSVQQASRETQDLALQEKKQEKSAALPIITERVCRAFVYSKAVLYRDAGAGTNECPVGYMYIHSRYDCRLAASALYPHAVDQTKTPMSSPDVPKGCHLEFPTGNIFVNEHTVGASTNDHNLLCKAVYADAGSNTNTCPSGYEAFIGMDMCTTAASALYPGQIDSIEFGSFQGHPGGCVYRHTTKSLLINSHKGRATWDSNLLCRTTADAFAQNMETADLNATELNDVAVGL